MQAALCSSTLLRLRPRFMGARALRGGPGGGVARDSGLPEIYDSDGGERPPAQEAVFGKSENSGLACMHELGSVRGLRQYDRCCGSRV
jgi:hypothetical protein